MSAKNEKAKLWVNGRKQIFQHLKIAFSNNSSPVVWIHCASLGEFEQGRPIIELIKKQYPAYKILLTFFSPSGFEVRKNYPLADWIFYLPMDGKKNAATFINIVQPKLIFFVKYEFWWFYLSEAKQRKIPIYLISGIFRPEQIFFKWYGGFYRKMLQCFSHIFVQNNTSKQLLENLNLNNSVSINGDTRFDRVIEQAKEFSSIPLVEHFIQNSKQIIVAGSTWLEDDKILAVVAENNPNTKFIIAPHAINSERIEQCLSLYNRSITFSSLTKNLNHTQSKNVLIIDNIGMLVSLYKYASICYVGGGFTKDGIHNVLEPAVYGKPIFIGPNFKKYAEAADLIALEVIYSIKNALELEHKLSLLSNDKLLYKKASLNAVDYVQQNAGATKFIEAYIYENRLLTN